MISDDALGSWATLEGGVLETGDALERKEVHSGGSVQWHTSYAVGRHVRYAIV